MEGEEEEEEVEVVVDDDDASAAATRVASELPPSGATSSLSAAWIDATETEEEYEEEEAEEEEEPSPLSFIVSLAFAPPAAAIAASRALAAFAGADRSNLLRSSAPETGSRGSVLIFAIRSLDFEADCVDSAERIRCSPSPVAVAVRKSVGAAAEKTRASCD